MENLTIGTLANIIKHGDSLCDLLRGGNTPQTVGKLKAVVDNPQLLGKLLSALDGMEQNLRALKLSPVTVEVSRE